MTSANLFYLIIIYGTYMQILVALSCPDNGIHDLIDMPSISKLPKHLRTAYEIKETISYADSLNAIHTLPDGRFVASGNFEGDILLWDPRDEHFNSPSAPVKIFSGHMGGIFSFATFTDGRLLSCAEDNTIILWNTDDENDFKVFRDFSDTFFVGGCYLAVMSDQEHFITSAGADDKTIKLWNANSDEYSSFPSPHEVTSLLALPDGKFISGHKYSKLSLWDPSDSSNDSRVKEYSRVHTTGFGSIVNLLLLPDNRRFLCSIDDSVVLWDLDQETPVKTLFDNGKLGTWIYSLSLLPDGTIISTSAPKSIHIWDISDSVGEVIMELDTPTDNEFIGLLPDGSFISDLSDDNGSFSLWGPVYEIDGEDTTVFSFYGYDVDYSDYNSVAVFPDGKFLTGVYTTIDYRSQILLWGKSEDEDKGYEVIKSFPTMFESSFKQIYVVPNNDTDTKFLCSSIFSQEIELWDLSDNETPSMKFESPETIDFMIVLPDARFITANSHKDTMYLWTLTSLNYIKTFIFPEDVDDITLIEALPNGNFITALKMSGGYFNMAIWNPSSDSSIMTHSNVMDEIYALLVFPDGRYLASGKISGSYEMKLWDSSDDIDNSPIRFSLDDEVSMLALLPDGIFISRSGSEQGHLLVWDPSIGSDNNPVKSIKEVKDLANVVALPNDGMYISIYEDGTMKIRDDLIRSCGSPNVFCLHINATSGFVCPSGYLCEAEAWCPKPCPRGSYCDREFMTTPIPCDGGTYNNFTARPNQCGDICAPGEYCPEGSPLPIKCLEGTYVSTIKSTVCNNCTLGQKCDEEGTTFPQLCPVGSYCPSPSEIYECETHNYCPTNTTTPTFCPAGTFCPSPSVSISCGSGFECPEGSTTITMCEKGYVCINSTSKIKCSSGSYCPIGATEESKCPAGSFCENPTKQQICVIGSYCEEGSVVENPCEVGHYCPNTTSKLPCSSSSIKAVYCSEGSIEESECLGGYYCPNTASKLPCYPGVFCPTGSRFPLPCPEGYYCPGKSPIPLLCRSGTYCPLNSTAPQKCEAGYYCETAAQMVLCDPGTICEVNSTFPVICEAGYYCDGILSISCTPGSYCPSGVSTKFPCEAGFYCEDPTKQVACSSGEYCAENSTSPIGCPSGWYCETPAMKTVCDPGTYCSENSTSPKPCDAGTYAPGFKHEVCLSCNNGEYCPSGSKAQTQCAVGYFCPNPSSQTKCGGGTYCREGSTSLTICPPGYWCDGGNNTTPCPIGTYCPTGTTDPLNCTAIGSYCEETTDIETPCPEGYYCPSTKERIPCTTLGTYCTEGSSYESACPTGFYCSDFISVVKCCTGSYCPSGTYEIDPPCPGGLYCPTPSQQINCSEGFYCPQGTADPNECKIGFYCPNTTTEIICPKGTYCEPRSSKPTNCPIGSYRDKEEGKVKESCTSCPPFRSTINDGATDIDSCLCDKGYFESSPGTCKQCIKDIMICSDVGTLVEKIKVAPGYWRSDSSTTDFIECPLGSGSCNGNDNNLTTAISSSSNGCSEGHEGFICATCSTGYYRNPSDRNSMCMVCDKSMRKLGFDALLLVFGGFFIFLLISRSLRKGEMYSKELAKKEEEVIVDDNIVSNPLKMVNENRGDVESCVTAATSTITTNDVPNITMTRSKPSRQYSRNIISENIESSPRSSTTRRNLEFNLYHPREVVKQSDRSRSESDHLSRGGNINGVLPTTRARKETKIASRKKHSVVQRLALTHLQVIGLVGKFNLAWPPMLNLGFSIIDSVSSLSPTTSVNGSIDCYLRPSNMMIPVFNILVSIGFLLLILTLITLLWFVIIPCFGLCQRRTDNGSNGNRISSYTKFISSIIALFYISYSSMARTGLGIFHCGVFPGETSSRLFNALDYNCFEDEHLQWVLSVGIPYTLTVVIGVPFIAWLILYKNRKNLIAADRQEVVERYGFLFAGYKMKYWYWEAVILTRKLSLAALTVFLYSSSSYTQGLTALIIMVAALCIHLFFNPYEDQKLNNLESAGLVCSVLTIYFGLWTFEQKDNLVISWIATVLIVTMNAVWFTYVILIIFDKYKSRITKFVNNNKLDSPRSKSNKKQENSSMRKDNETVNEFTSTTRANVELINPMFEY